MCAHEHEHEHHQHRHEHHQHRHARRHERHQARAYRWHGPGFDEDIERQVHAARQHVRDAMAQVEINLETNLRPALKRVKRELKNLNIQGVVDSALGAAQGWAAAETPEPPSETFAEERMTILRLLQEGKLTPDEAARLLDAL